MQCQLDRKRIVESNKEGVTRLAPKVNGVPSVDELRPITLLNCDYKILTMWLVRRMKPVLPYVIKSGQLQTWKSRKHASIACGQFLRRFWTFLEKTTIFLQLLPINVHKSALSSTNYPFLLEIPDIMEKIAILGTFMCIGTM